MCRFDLDEDMGDDSSKEVSKATATFTPAKSTNGKFKCDVCGREYKHRRQ